jgi:ABC-type uncharacterized transport system substrate-binding protein
LGETGHIENVTIDYRWAEGHYDRLHAMATDLVGRQVKVIVPTGNTATAHAVKATLDKGVVMKVTPVLCVLLAGSLGAAHAADIRVLVRRQRQG